MAYTLSPKDGMSNTSGKHLVQRRGKVAKVPTYSRIDKDGTPFHLIFSRNDEAEQGRSPAEVPLEGVPC